MVSVLTPLIKGVNKQFRLLLNDSIANKALLRKWGDIASWIDLAMS